MSLQEEKLHIDARSLQKKELHIVFLFLSEFSQSWLNFPIQYTFHFLFSFSTPPRTSSPPFPPNCIASLPSSLSLPLSKKKTHQKMKSESNNNNNKTSMSHELPKQNTPTLKMQLWNVEILFIIICGSGLESYERRLPSELCYSEHRPEEQEMLPMKVYSQELMPPVDYSFNWCYQTLNRIIYFIQVSRWLTPR